MSISKFKKPYKLFLAPYYQDKQLAQEPHEYSLVYLKSFQESVPAKAQIEICTAELDLTFKREAVLVYEVLKTDHEKKEIHATLKGIKKKEYHGFSRALNSKLISVTTKINGVKTAYTICYKSLLRSKELSSLKKEVAQFLNEELKEPLSSIEKIASRDLNDKIQKIVGSTVASFKGIIINSYNC